MSMLPIVKALSDTNINVNGNSYSTNLPSVNSSGSELTTVLNIAIGIIATISVLFVVIGGLRYVISDGDPQKAKRAKDTIIYAVVGLLISISAEAIVALVLTRVNNGT
jgi:hypothetical protein